MTIEAQAYNEAVDAESRAWRDYSAAILDKKSADEVYTLGAAARRASDKRAHAAHRLAIQGLGPLP